MTASWYLKMNADEMSNKSFGHDLQKELQEIIHTLITVCN